LSKQKFFDERIPEHVNLANQFGIVKLGYTLEDYLIEAVNENGYETVCIWGVQGSGKSNRSLQMGYWIYEDWNKVLDNIIFKPSELVKRLEATPDDERIPCLIWDDVGVHYPSSKFKTDIKEYEAVDEVWAAIRTKVAVVVLTIPLVNRLAKNLRDNLTFEIYLGRNQKEIINRIYHLPGLDDIHSNFFKVMVEWPESFDLYKVPANIWWKYWAMRLRLTREALENLKGVTNMENMDEFTPVWEIAKELTISANTLHQMGSRRIIPIQTVNGQLCVPNTFIPELRTQYTKRPA